MREIKFRAWHSKNKELVYFDNEKLKKDHYQAGYLISLMAGDFGGVLNQYADRKDKNDVEIYEGDLISGVVFGSNQIFEVIFKRGCFGVKAKMLGGDHLEFWPFCDSIDVEIVGNIYENPELLENEK